MVLIPTLLLSLQRQYITFKKTNKRIQKQFILVKASYIYKRVNGTS
jgi:hypothetical protein